MATTSSSFNPLAPLWQIVDLLILGSSILGSITLIGESGSAASCRCDVHEGVEWKAMQIHFPLSRHLVPLWAREVCSSGVGSFLEPGTVQAAGARCLQVCNAMIRQYARINGRAVLILQVLRNDARYSWSMMVVDERLPQRDPSRIGLARTGKPDFTMFDWLDAGVSILASNDLFRLGLGQGQMIWGLLLVFDAIVVNEQYVPFRTWEKATRGMEIVQKEHQHCFCSTARLLSSCHVVPIAQREAKPLRFCNRKAIILCTRDVLYLLETRGWDASAMQHVQRGGGKDRKHKGGSG